MGEPIKEGSLTGRRQYRMVGPRWRHVVQGLILQVQINTWAQGREDKLGRWVTTWRDATPDDVSKDQLA